MRTLTLSVVSLIALGLSAEALPAFAASSSSSSVRSSASSAKSVRKASKSSLKSSKKSAKSSSKSSKQATAGAAGVFPIAEDWRESWGIVSSQVYGSVTVHDDEKPAFMRAAMPKGSYLGNYYTGQGAGGADFSATGGFSPADRVILSFDIRIPTDFQFNRGGYLPCFYGGYGKTKTNIACNLAWDRDGKIWVYTNFPNTLNDDVYTSATAGTLKADGKWHTIEVDGSMNSGIKGNGTLKISLDGESIMKSDKVMFRTKETDKFEGFYMAVFYRAKNGSSLDAAPADTYIDFANISLKSKK